MTLHIKIGSSSLTLRGAQPRGVRTQQELPDRGFPLGGPARETEGRSAVGVGRPAGLCVSRLSRSLPHDRPDQHHLRRAHLRRSAGRGPGARRGKTGTVLIKAFAWGSATVIINRPDKKNAFNQEVIGGLREAFESFHGADHVRVVFVRGAGGSFLASWRRPGMDARQCRLGRDRQPRRRLSARAHVEGVARHPRAHRGPGRGAAFGGGVA